jgi:hypothetical protein
MNKSMSISFTFVLVLTMVLATVPGTVLAKPSTPSSVADGNWTVGTAAVLNLTGTVYPEWLQLMDIKGVVITAPGQVCHPFRGGNYGWTADIRQLVGDTWEKVTTTMSWVPDEDGQYMACAAAQTAGTYALFGYYDPAKDPKIIKNAACQYGNWVAYFWYHDDGYPWEPGYSLEVHLADDPSVFPLGETVSYTILRDTPIPGWTDLPLTGTTTSWEDGEVYATFTDYVYTGDFSDLPDFSTSIQIETGGCSYILPLTNIDFCDIYGCD